MRNKLTTHHETVARVALGGWRNGLLTSSAARRVRYHTSPSYLAKRSHSLILTRNPLIRANFSFYPCHSAQFFPSSRRERKTWVLYSTYVVVRTVRSNLTLLRADAALKSGRATTRSDATKKTGNRKLSTRAFNRYDTLRYSIFNI